MKPYERIFLPNGLEAEVYDLSRPIAADTMKVEMAIRIRVALRPEYFAAPAHFEQTRKVFGPEIIYEHRTGQSFVINEEKEAVFGALLESFRKDALPYLSGEKFPGRFAMSRFTEIAKRPYTYPDHQQEPQ
jgi:hypothetical protein